MQRGSRGGTRSGKGIRWRRTSGRLHAAVRVRQAQSCSSAASSVLRQCACGPGRRAHGGLKRCSPAQQAAAPGAGQGGGSA